MDVKKTVDDITAWFKDPKIVKGISMYIVVIILMAINFSYWAGAIDVSTIGAPSPVDNGDTVEEGDYILVRHLVLDQTGPGGTPASSTSVNFNLEEGGKILILNLSCPNPRPIMPTDYDLVLKGPDGNDMGSSMDPGSDEQIIIDYTKQANKTLEAGTYEAVIQFFSGTMGTSWHLEVTVWYMEMCDDDGCTI